MPAVDMQLIMTHKWYIRDAKKSKHDHDMKSH